MENRKEQDVQLILDSIIDIWILSPDEYEVLESVLNLFAENKEIEQLEYLLNDETTSLLSTLYQKEITNYALDNLNLIENDERYLVDALEDLKYDFMDSVDIDDMIEHLEKNGYSVSGDKEDNLDIVTQSDLDELVSNFLSADFQTRKYILNMSDVKNIDDNLVSFANKYLKT